MSPSLLAEYEHLTTRLDQMVERIKQLPSDTQRTPVGKSFSPEKALEHMAVLEKSYVDLAAKTDREAMKGKKGKPNFIFPLVLKSMSKPASSASPTPRMFQPSGAMSIEESAKLWRERRMQLLEYLKQFDDDDACLKNPLMGRLSPRDLYVLLERHQDYHDARLPE